MDVPHVRVKQPRALVPVHNLLKLLLELILPANTRLVMQEELLQLPFHDGKQCFSLVQLRCSRWQVVWSEIILDEGAYTSGDAEMGRVPVHNQYDSLISTTVLPLLENALKERNELNTTGSTASSENGTLKNAGVADATVYCDGLQVLIVLGGVYCAVFPLPGLCLEVIEHDSSLINVAQGNILVHKREQFPSSLGLLSQILGSV